MYALLLKQQIRQRDGMRCTICGMTNEEHLRLTRDSLHVHRLEPGSVYTMEGCVTVCSSCHGPLPRRQPGAPDLASPGGLVALPRPLYAAMKALAQENDRPLTREVVRALTAHLVAHGKLPRKGGES